MRQPIHPDHRLNRVAILSKVTPVMGADLLNELHIAHLIINNALSLMTSEQKNDWAILNRRDDLIEFGTTRAHERDAVVVAARGAQ